jgi:hypothetical protein
VLFDNAFPYMSDIHRPVLTMQLGEGTFKAMVVKGTVL